jgi:hypothetical protein
MQQVLDNIVRRVTNISIQSDPPGMTRSKQARRVGKAIERPRLCQPVTELAIDSCAHLRTMEQVLGVDSEQAVPSSASRVPEKSRGKK